MTKHPKFVHVVIVFDQNEEDAPTLETLKSYAKTLDLTNCEYGYAYKGCWVEGLHA